MSENKTILLAIAHYGKNNREHLLRCLGEYNKFQGYSITVHLYITEEFDVSEFKNLSIYFSIYPQDIGHMLVQQHKPWFAEHCREFDYYIYCEDDVFITPSHFEVYREVQDKLPAPFSCGFMRYEYKPNNEYKFLLDQHPLHSVHRRGSTVIKSNYIIKGEPYFEVYNVHQGCYILTRELMVKAVESGKYLERHGYYAGAPLEGAASDVYYKCGLVKVIPRNRVSELIVHHLPNKYVNWHPHIYTEETTPDDNKIAQMQLDIAPTYVV